MHSCGMAGREHNTKVKIQAVISFPWAEIEHREWFSKDLFQVSYSSTALRLMEVGSIGYAM